MMAEASRVVSSPAADTTPSREPAARLTTSESRGATAAAVSTPRGPAAAAAGTRPAAVPHTGDAEAVTDVSPPSDVRSPSTLTSGSVMSAPGVTSPATGGAVTRPRPPLPSDAGVRPPGAVHRTAAAAFSPPPPLPPSQPPLPPDSASAVESPLATRSVSRGGRGTGHSLAPSSDASSVRDGSAARSAVSTHDRSVMYPPSAIGSSVLMAPRATDPVEYRVPFGFTGTWKVDRYCRTAGMECCCVHPAV
jgi:hypothetical protein